MRKLLIATAAIGGLLALSGGAMAEPWVNHGDQYRHERIQRADYYWHHHRYHHRRWEHDHWRYWD